MVFLEHVVLLLLVYLQYFQGWRLFLLYFFFAVSIAPLNVKHTFPFDWARYVWFFGLSAFVISPSIYHLNLMQSDRTISIEAMSAKY